MKKFEKVLWILIVIVIIGVATTHGYLFWQMKGVRKSISDTDKQIHLLQARITELQAKKNAIPKLQSFFSMINSRILLQPEAKSYLDYITSNLDEYATSYSINVGSVESIAGQYEIVNIAISFNSKKYSDAMAVIKAVESVKQWTEITLPPSVSYVNDGYSISFSLLIPYVTDISDNLWDIK